MLAQSANTMQGSLEELNDSGESGSASVTFDGDQATVEITSSGLLDGSPHAMHIHDLETGTSECPTLDADEDGDGLVNTVEGQPSYGPINVSLTTEGDVSADSALAVERFPATGDIDYSRTFSCLTASAPTASVTSSSSVSTASTSTAAVSTTATR